MTIYSEMKLNHPGMFHIVPILGNSVLKYKNLLHSSTGGPVKFEMSEIVLSVCMAGCQVNMAPCKHIPGRGPISHSQVVGSL